MAYGVKIFNASGTTLIEPSSRKLNIVVPVGTTSATTPSSGSSYTGYSPYITFTGMTPSNTDEFDVAVTSPGIDSSTGSTGQYDRVAVERGTNQFRFAYTSFGNNRTLSIIYFCFRF